MFTGSFFADAFERAVRTFAQGVLGAVSAGAVGVVDVDWGQAASIGGLAAVMSLLTSVIATGVGVKGTASFVE
jgi:hypothetical protein